MKVACCGWGRGQGHLSASSQAESGGAEWNVECGEHVGLTVSGVLEQSNLTILFWMFANCGGLWCWCGARHGRTLCLAGLIVEPLAGGGRGAPSVSACWRAVEGGHDSPECLKKENFRKCGLFVTNWQDCGYQSWRGVRGTPRRVRPPNFGANGPLVGPGDPQWVFYR